MSAKEYTTLLQSHAVTTEQEPELYHQASASAVLLEAQPRVLICDPISPMALECLRGFGMKVDERIGLTPDALEALIGDYDAIVVRSTTQLSAQLIAAAHKLRLIIRGGIGTDNIDLAAAASHHITVLNTPKASTVSVAELALGQLLALARQIPLADTAVKAGEWPKKALSNGIELRGKTLGIIGVGRIGGTLGHYAAALGMIVVGTDKRTRPSGGFDGIELLPLEALLARADFISVHTPRLNGRPIIGRQEIAQMKDGVLLLNCARGGLIDEMALLEALESGKVRGAALDVFSEEPPGHQPLVLHPRVICTPHIGGATREAQERIGMEVARLLLDTL